MVDVNILSQPSDSVGTAIAVANVLIALAALSAAWISIKFTRDSLRTQQKHNFLSVKPIPKIEVFDYEDCLLVKISNNGVGPLVLKTFTARVGDTVSDDLISLMPTSKFAWRNFVTYVADDVIPAGDESKILELEIDTNDLEFMAYANDCRMVLKDVSLKLEYTDIYDNQFEPEARDLAWFGRRWQ